METGELASGAGDMVVDAEEGGKTMRAPSFSPAKISLYELLLRQLRDDGFEDVAAELSEQTNITPNSLASPDFLVHLYEERGYGYSPSLPRDGQVINRGGDNQKTERDPSGALEMTAEQREKEGVLVRPDGVQVRGWKPIGTSGRLLMPETEAKAWMLNLEANQRHVLPIPLIKARFHVQVRQAHSGCVRFSPDGAFLGMAAETDVKVSAGLPRRREADTDVTEREGKGGMGSGDGGNATNIGTAGSQRIGSPGGVAGVAGGEMWRGAVGGQQQERERERAAQVQAAVQTSLRSFAGHTARVTCLDFHPDTTHTRLFFSGDVAGNVNVFSYATSGTKRPIESLMDAFPPINTVCVNPTGDFLLVGTDHNIIRIYDTQRYHCRAAKNENDHHRGAVRVIRFGSDPSVYVSGGSDGLVVFWDTRTSSRVNAIEMAHQGAEITSIEFSRNRRHFVTGGQDGKARLWDLRNGKEIRDFGGGNKKVDKFFAQFCYDEHFMAVLSSDRLLRDVQLFNSATGAKITNLNLQGSGAVSSCLSLATSPSDFTFAALMDDGRCRLLEAVFK